MAVDVEITPVTNLTVNTRSADLIGAGASVDATETFSIDAKGETRNLLIFLEEEGTGAAAVTFDPGANPPSLLGELDTDGITIALAQADLRLVPLEPGQFIAADGKIYGSVATNDVRIYAIRLPREM